MLLCNISVKLYRPWVACLKVVVPLKDIHFCCTFHRIYDVWTSLSVLLLYFLNFFLTLFWYLSYSFFLFQEVFSSMHPEYLELTVVANCYLNKVGCNLLLPLVFTQYNRKSNINLSWFSVWVGSNVFVRKESCRTIYTMCTLHLLSTADRESFYFCFFNVTMEKSNKH